MSVMFVGEALVSEGNDLDNVAHIDLLIGPKTGPVGVAFANALANQSAGHTNLLAVVSPEHALQAGHGDDHQGDASRAASRRCRCSARPRPPSPGRSRTASWTASSRRQGRGLGDRLRRVHRPRRANDNKKIYKYNYEATKLAIKNADEERARRSTTSSPRRTRQAPVRVQEFSDFSDQYSVFSQQRDVR